MYQSTDHSITLSSGETTKYYYDIRALFDGKGLNLLGELLLEEILKFNPKSVGGLEVGAIPLISVVVAMAYNKNTNRNQDKWVLCEKIIEATRFTKEN